jgi:hypothetical protein
MRSAFSLTAAGGAAREDAMRERTDRDSMGRAAAGGAAERAERRPPQVEVIREPNPIDESELAEPSAGE